MTEMEKMVAGMLGGHDGPFFMEPPIRFDFYRNTFIGRNFYSNYNLVVLDCAL